MPFKRTITPNKLYTDESKRLTSEAEQEYKENNRKYILSVSERAFRHYAKCHKASEEVENLECQRYLKILKSML